MRELVKRFLVRSCFEGGDGGGGKRIKAGEKNGGVSPAEKKHWLAAELEQRTDDSRTALRSPRQNPQQTEMEMRRKIEKEKERN